MRLPTSLLNIKSLNFIFLIIAICNTSIVCTKACEDPSKNPSSSQKTDISEIKLIGGHHVAVVYQEVGKAIEISFQETNRDFNPPARSKSSGWINNIPDFYNMTSSQMLEQFQNKKVLDLACGTRANFAKELSKNGAKYGIEVSALDVALGDQYCDGKRFYKGDMSKMPQFSDSSMDVIMSTWGPFSYLESPKHHNRDHGFDSLRKTCIESLKEIKRILVPGGVLMVAPIAKFSATLDKNDKNEFQIFKDMVEEVGGLEVVLDEHITESRFADIYHVKVIKK